jgi:hypothetical protein
MKPVMMIHEVREWMFNLPLKDYTLTFDDGLFSQYYFLERFKAIDTDKIFFISTNIVCPEDITQSQEFPRCDEAHEEFFSNGNLEHYMKWSQIKEIAKTPGCFIGGHSHNHNIYKKIGIRELYAELIADTELMLEAFQKNQVRIDKFCYPYNEEYVLYNTILRKNGITDIYGKDRIAIEALGKQDA